MQLKPQQQLCQPLKTIKIIQKQLFQKDKTKKFIILLKKLNLLNKLNKPNLLLKLNKLNHVQDNQQHKCWLLQINLLK